MKRNRFFTTSIAVFILCSMVLLPGCRKGKKKGTTKVILDCDMGDMNDDALALSMLIQEEKEGEIEVVGITLEGGNVLIDAEFESEGKVQTCAWDNTQAFLEKVGRTDIPVYRGTDLPIGYTQENISELAQFYKTADYLPYCDAYGAIHAYTRTTHGRLCDSDEAAQFLIDTVKKYPGEVVIVASGPTMNIARAIKQDDTFARNVMAIYYMGGALGARYEVMSMQGRQVQAIEGANVTPFAEYNVLYDPVAFDICLTAGFPKQVISPAEMCMAFDEGVYDKWRATDTSGSVSHAWMQQYEVLLPDMPYWDPIIAYALIRPSCVTLTEQYITVNTNREEDEFGATYSISVDQYNQLPEEEKHAYGAISVVTKVEDFWEETIALLGKK